MHLNAILACEKDTELLGLECTHSLMIRFDKGNRREKINDPFLWITSQGDFFPTERPPILETDSQKKEHEMVVKTSIGVQSSSWLLDEKMARKTSRAFFLLTLKNSASIVLVSLSFLCRGTQKAEISATKWKKYSNKLVGLSLTYIKHLELKDTL